MLRDSITPSEFGQPVQSGVRRRVTLIGINPIMKPTAKQPYQKHR